MKTQAIGMLRGFLITLLLAACAPPGPTATPAPTRTPLPTLRPLQNDSRTVEHGGARTARVELDIANGDVVVTGGAADLLEARFIYNIVGWQPVVEYGVEAGEGRLSIAQGEADAPSDRDVRNEWSLRLNNRIPTALHARAGSASTHFQVQNLALTELDVETGSGPVNVYLARNHPDLTAVVLETASGSVEMDLSGDYRALAQVSVTTESGALRIGLTGTFPILAEASFANASGSTSFDLTGDWTRDLDLTFTGSSGAVDVLLPERINAFVEVTGASAQVRADDFTEEEGGVYTRRPFGAPDVTLNLHIRLESGSVTLETRH